MFYNISNNNDLFSQGKVLPAGGDTTMTTTTNGTGLIRGPQMIRPAIVSSSGGPVVATVPILPSYSQAMSSQSTGGATVVRAIRPAVAGAGGGGAGGGRRPPEAVALNGSAGGKRFSLTVPALSALLAGRFIFSHFVYGS